MLPATFCANPSARRADPSEWRHADTVVDRRRSRLRSFRSSQLAQRCRQNGAPSRRPPRRANTHIAALEVCVTTGATNDFVPRVVGDDHDERGRAQRSITTVELLVRTPVTHPDSAVRLATVARNRPVGR
jgi:hypothetical protein